MTTEFDPNLYTRAPATDVPGAYSLGVAVLAAVPTDASRDSRVRASARALRASVIALRDAWTARVKIGDPDRRAFDAVADASWRALNWALESITLITGTPADDARATRARAMLERVFPDGLAFTQLTYTSQWAHADRLLAQIDADGLGAELDRLVGAPYLAFIRRAHASYGEALRITEAADAATVGVREPLRALQVAVQEYVFALFAEHPPSNPENHPRLRKALAPIDAFRASQQRAEPATRPAGPPGPAAPEPAGPPPSDPIPEV
ncbi:hypothetical protein [Sandaracinus amylolyticus]|uniref:hypothetical protein n=1 Tax=Sandaracinus amylolyticus TaxID=927083 RepID=UPI0012ECE6F5|nr:hypothetical protein [Sandaracinus amylolyticus]